VVVPRPGGPSALGKGKTEPEVNVGEGEARAPRGVGALYNVLTSRNWVSLAVVSAEEGDRAWWLVQALEQIATRAHGPLRALNVLGVTEARATALVHALSPAKIRAASQRYLLATDSPLLNPAAIGVITACDGVLLLLEEGRTPIPRARRLAGLIGRERLMGAVLGSW
jgi:hypothetical protein